MHTNTIRTLTALGLAALTTGGFALSATSTTLAAPHKAPVVDPADFDSPQPNAYFPLEVGTVSRFRGSESGTHFRQRMEITDRTKTIEGIETIVVRDVIRRMDGSLKEKTHDWYANDNDGNVWYFGEDTATYDKQGNLKDRDGSWQTGVDGAVPGTIMPADPRPTNAFRQEFERGEAEDQAWVVQRHASTTVPYGHVAEAVRTFEWSRLEKHVVAEKLYGPGVGIVKEEDLSGGNETVRLVSVKNP